MSQISFRQRSTENGLIPYEQAGMSGDPRFRFLVPIYAPGKEPLPPGFTEDDRAAMAQVKKYETFASVAQESCLFKSAMSAVIGACIHRARVRN